MRYISKEQHVSSSSTGQRCTHVLRIGMVATVVVLTILGAVTGYLSRHFAGEASLFKGFETNVRDCHSHPVACLNHSLHIIEELLELAKIKLMISSDGTDKGGGGDDPHWDSQQVNSTPELAIVKFNGSYQLVNAGNATCATKLAVDARNSSGNSSGNSSTDMHGVLCYNNTSAPPPSVILNHTRGTLTPPKTTLETNASHFDDFRESMEDLAASTLHAMAPNSCTEVPPSQEGYHYVRSFREKGKVSRFKCLPNPSCGEGMWNRVYEMHSTSRGDLPTFECPGSLRYEKLNSSPDYLGCSLPGNERCSRFSLDADIAGGFNQVCAEVGLYSNLYSTVQSRSMVAVFSTHKNIRMGTVALFKLDREVASTSSCETDFDVGMYRFIRNDLVHVRDAEMVVGCISVNLNGKQDRASPDKDRTSRPEKVLKYEMKETTHGQVHVKLCSINYHDSKSNGLIGLERLAVYVR